METMWILLLIFASNAVIALSVSETPTCSWTDCDVSCGTGVRTCTRSTGQTWNIKCHTQSCTPLSGCGSADVVFILDSTASIGERNWWRTKQFAIDVVKGSNLIQTGIRFGMVIFSDNALIKWELGDNVSVEGLEEAIWGLEWLQGQTNTQEAIIAANLIFTQSSRQGVPKIAVLVSDGVSNIHEVNTIPASRILKSNGAEVFSIGVGLVNPSELQAISSEPVSSHYYSVNQYTGLMNLTNSLISSTCAQDPSSPEETSPKPTTATKSPTSPEPASTLVRKPTTSIEPTTMQQPTTTPEPTAPSPSPSADHCARCVYNDYGAGYLPVESNCHMFIQCQRLQTGFLHAEKSCGVLFWRQSILSCDYSKDVDATCHDGPIVTKPTEPPAEEACDKAPAYREVDYIWTPVEGISYLITCAPGTVFSQDDCKCVTGVNIVACSSDAMLEFRFNTNYDDMCNRAVGTPWGNMKLEDGAAYFDGNSRVEVGYLKNWFAENPSTSLTLSLWFRYTGLSDDNKGLFSNGDCKDGASLLLAVGDYVAQGQIIANHITASFSSNDQNRAFTRDEWTFVTMVYSGWDVKYYVNGQMKSQQSVSGNIANTQCASHIGFTGQNNAEHFFEGYIDDVRVYRHVLYDYYIGELYRNGRQ